MKTYTIKQLVAVRKGQYGTATGLIHKLADTALAELGRNGDAEDELRRCNATLREFTELRPEHERVLIVLTRPLGDGGLPAIEVFTDARVKLRVAFEDDELPWIWLPLLERQPEVQVIPDWLFSHA